MFVNSKLSQSAKTRMKLYKPGHVLPVLAPTEFLAAGRHQALLQQIYDMSALDQTTFSLLYEPVMLNFTDYVQMLPATTDGVLCSLLNEGLARATLVMRSYTIENGDVIDPLMRYAVFTAGLLREVSKIITLYRVVLCQEKGDYIDDWYPFAGPMHESAEFYKIYPLSTIYQRLDVSITPLLARQLLPKDGFDWLTADLLVFADWLDALSGEGRFGGAICHIFGLMRREDLFNMLEALPQVDVEQLLSQDTQYGESFYEWLKNGIEKGDIKVNSSDSGVHVVADGIFLESAKVFQQFASLSNSPVNDAAVFQQFGNLMGIAAKGGNDFFNAQFFSKSAVAASNASTGFAGSMGQRQSGMVSGMLIADKARIFTGSDVPEVSQQLQSKQTRVTSNHQLPAGLLQSSLSSQPK